MRECLKFQLKLTSPLASQEIPSRLYNLNVHYRIQKILSPIYLVFQRSTFHILIPCSSKNRFSIILPSTPTSPGRTVPLCLQTKFFHAFLIAAMRATCPSWFDRRNIVWWREYHYSVFSMLLLLPVFYIQMFCFWDTISLCCVNVSFWTFRKPVSAFVVG